MSKAFRETRNGAWKQLEEDDPDGLAAANCLKHGSRVTRRERTRKKNGGEWRDFSGKTNPYRPGRREEGIF